MLRNKCATLRHKIYWFLCLLLNDIDRFSPIYTSKYG